MFSDIQFPRACTPLTEATRDEPMPLKFNIVTGAIATGLARCRAMLASGIRARIQARRRRVEQEKEFYQKLAAYCRSNNLPVVCGEDWKSAAYSKDR